MKQDDMELVMHWRMSPEVSKYMFTDPKLTISSQLEWYKKISASSFDKYWIVELLQEEIPVGVISLNKIDYVNLHCSWAYYIGDLRARGKGLATILECNINDYVFDTLKLNKIWGEAFKFNEKVISIHQKFGNKIEGVFKDHIFKNGQFYDVVRYAIRKEEWLQIRSNFNYVRIDIE